MKTSHKMTFLVGCDCLMWILFVFMTHHFLFPIILIVFVMVYVWVCVFECV